MAAATASPQPITSGLPPALRPTTAQTTKPVQSKQTRSGTQKRLFSSISRFLTGGAKTRPKLPQVQSEPHSIRADADAENAGGVPLTDVRNGSLSSRSNRALSTSTADSRLDDGEDDGELPSHQGPLINDAASSISGISGADTDASIRPISPTSLAPSSIMSHAPSYTTSTNASIANTHRTYKSYASTKPTTLFSVDSTGGANRIAVVPGTSAIPASTSGGSLAAAASGSGSAAPGSGAISFSALPPATPPTPTSPLANQVPHHTNAHPRNNPHPLSPAQDNASMLTLASSSFAPSIFLSGSRTGPTSLLRARGHYEADEDASVRALAGSRRASDESLDRRSTWSAAVLGRDKVDNDGTASVRTMGTTGTGGGMGGETEAQKVVRQADQGPQGVLGTPLTEEQTTPTEEVDEPSTSSSRHPGSSTRDGERDSGTSTPGVDERSVSTPATPRTPAFSQSAENLATKLEVLTSPAARSEPVSAEVNASSSLPTVVTTSIDDEQLHDGVVTPTRDVKGKGKERDDGQSFVSGVSGYETADARSFVDARSVADSSDADDDTSNRF